VKIQASSGKAHGKQRQSVSRCDFENADPLSFSRTIGQEATSLLTIEVMEGRKNRTEARRKRCRNCGIRRLHYKIKVRLGDFMGFARGQKETCR